VFDEQQFFRELFLATFNTINQFSIITVFGIAIYYSQDD